MNYYIDFIPNQNFIKKISPYLLNKNDSIIFNVYIKELPSMNIKKCLYRSFKEYPPLISEIKKSGYKVNVVFDTFCFGNKEFTKEGKNIFLILDYILDLGIDFITITNNFFFNYVKRRHPNCKIIISEYSEINNVQKICRYLDDMEANAVKIDTLLSKDLKTMTYIRDNFDINSIHIDTNKIAYENDIFKDSLNNSISHYIQEEKWEEVNASLKIYENEQKSLNNKKIHLETEDINNLKQLGFKNFWYHCDAEEDIYDFV